MSANDIHAQLEEERQLIEGATGGPWEVTQSRLTHPENGGADIKGGGGFRVAADCCGYQGAIGEPTDAAFIAHARTALPVRNAQIEAVLQLCREMHAAYERDPHGDAIAYELERAIEEAGK